MRGACSSSEVRSWSRPPAQVLSPAAAVTSYGESDDFVRFRPAIRQAGWDGIELQEGVKHNIHRFDVRGAKNGFYIGENVEAEIHDCLVLLNKQGVETMNNGHPCSFHNCMIANNLTEGIRFHLNHMSFDHCTIANNGGIGLKMAYYGDLTITSCVISGNSLGIQSNEYEAKLQMKSSNIVENRTRAIEIKTPQDVQCRNNYWGIGNRQQIAEMISDGTRTQGHGIVHFEDFVGKPVADAGCSLRVPKRD